MDLKEKMNYRESCWKRGFFSSQPGNSIKHLNSFTASVKEFGKPEFLMLVRWVKHTESNITSGREELTVSHRERVQENSPICCGVLQAQTEHALNELLVTLRFTSILHEVSSSNRPGTILHHWLTWLSLRPDTHRDSSDHRDHMQFTHTQLQGLGADNGNSTADQGTLCYYI